jgi:6-phosphofructokinase 1
MAYQWFLHLQIVFTLETYGVKNIVGIPFGYRGFFEKGLKEMPVRMFVLCTLVLETQFMMLKFHFGNIIQLSRGLVENINLSGGSFLGVSRGGAKTSEIVDSIQVSNLNCEI